MSYQKTVWKNREVERPRTYNIQENEDGTITLIPAEGAIIEPGTPITAQVMQNIEDGIESHLAESAKDDVHGLKPVLLWDGNVKNPNTTITLTQSIAEFSRLDIIFDASGVELRTIYPHAYEEWTFRPVNLDNNLEDKYLYVFELGLSVVSNTQLQVTRNLNWYWSGTAASNASKLGGTQEIRRIYGIR